MDRSEVLTLVYVRHEQDETGVWNDIRMTRDIFCQVNSVSRDEFFQGGRSGLNPAYQFTAFAPDYHDETECIYKGRPYTIYRTYMSRNDTIELYAERRGGSNGSD